MSKTNVTWVARVSGTSGHFGVYSDNQADQLFIHKPDGSTVPITKDEFKSFIDWTHVSGSMADTRAQLSPQEWTELIIRTQRKLQEEGELKTAALAPVFAELLPKNAVLDIKMIGEREECEATMSRKTCGSGSTRCTRPLTSAWTPRLTSQLGRHPSRTNLGRMEITDDVTSIAG